MNAAFATGLLLTALGFAGYTVGISQAYPGRGFTVTAVMVGITLVAMRDAFGGERP
jgi:hypothetical protein